jgi:ankyrin repeat protein
LDNYFIVLKHSKSYSLETSERKPRSLSASKQRNTRSGTISSDPFRSTQLARSGSSLISIKKKKNVTFDAATTLLHLCQHPPLEIDEQVEAIYQCLSMDPNSTDAQKCSIDVNNIYTPQQWLTPLHVAAAHGHEELARILIEKAGAAVNIRDKEGWAPLHCAAAEGHLNIIKLLGKCQGNLALPEDGKGLDWIYCLDGPIDLEPENDDGEIPEEVAIEQEQEQIKIIFEGIAKDPYQ